MPSGRSIDRSTPTSSLDTVSSANSLSSMSLKQLSLSDIHTRQQPGPKERKHQVEKFAGTEKKTEKRTQQKLTSNRHELVSTSIDDHRFGDGLAIARHKWNFALGATHDRNRLPSVATHSKSVTSNGEQSSKPTLADIMFRFSQESQHERRTSWPNPSQVVNSAPMQKSSTPRRLRVNSIRASAHADRNERKVKLRRAQTAQEASIQGRSLRTLHQITHVEAIAASELERKRQKWLEGEEKRKMEERTCLQRKVDQFIAKVERDKRKQRFGKSKMTSVLEGDR